jgi:branched-chain amino acid transport system ATP-binding protein
VLFDGEDVSGLPAHELARRSVVHAPEGRSIFSTLSVEENLTLAFRQAGNGSVGQALDRAFALFPRLGERRNQLGGTLSGGEQRMLSLARVLVHPPKLLIVDELSLGLAPIVVAEVYEKLAELKDVGTTLLIVEQHVHHALEIADDVVILRKGQVEFSGPKSDLGDEADRLAPDVGD